MSKWLAIRRFEACVPQFISPLAVAVGRNDLGDTRVGLDLVQFVRIVQRMFAFAW